MRVPFKWLCEWLQGKDQLSLDEVIDALMQLGIEIEAIGEPTSQNRGLIAARIEKSYPFEQQPKLQIAEIFDGKSRYQIICKAPNCQKGLMVIFAPIGSQLANGLQIQDRFFGSFRSQGMLCGWEEIGLMPGHLDLVELPKTIAPGQSPLDWLADPILELAITPNLGHCLSVRGLAREVSRLLKIDCCMPSLPKSPLLHSLIQSDLSFFVEKSACSAVSWCQISRGDGALPATPTWLAKKLWQCGLRSINLIVDATNYVMLELGQPMHAYDLDSFGTSARLIRQKTEQRFQALDGQSICAVEGDVVVLTQGGQIASLAGIIGSEATAVHNNTHSAIIESAHFHPGDIQRTSRRLGLLTEASRRMERGVDPHEISFALKRVCSILALENISSSQVFEKILQVQRAIPILCRLEKTKALLGLSMSSDEFEDILKKCSFQPTFSAKGYWCSPPSYRYDLNCEVDLIAEIVRFIGLDRLPSRQSSWSNFGVMHDHSSLFETHLRKRCCQNGYAEILSNSLIGGKWRDLAQEQTLWQNFKKSLSVKKPKSVDHQYLRTGLLASFLQTLLQNQQRGIKRVRIFELARIYCEDMSDMLCEQTALAFLATNSTQLPHWSNSDSSYGFYEMKGEVENLLGGLGIAHFDVLPTDHSHFHPQRAAILKSDLITLGIFGQLHPSLIKKLGIDTEMVFFCQLSPNALQALSEGKFALQPLYNFPASQRDWTLTLAENFSYHRLRDLIPTRDLLISVNLMGVYKSEQLGFDRKNLTLRFCYRSDYQTLSQSEVDQEHASVTRELQERLGVHLLDANLIA